MEKKSAGVRKSLVADARTAARSCAGSNIRLAARRITRFLEERMATTGLSLAQFGLLTSIAAAEDDTIGALAASTGLDQSTLSRNLRGLEKEGLVEIAIVREDLRRRSVWLTEKGARHLEAALPVWRKAHDALARRVDTDQILTIAGVTAALASDRMPLTSGQGRE